MQARDPLGATLYLVEAAANALTGGPPGHGKHPFGDTGAAAASIRSAGAQEAAVLPAGSRTECYVVASSRDAALSAVRSGLRALSSAAAADVHPVLLLGGSAAARHLLATACDLGVPGTSDPPALARVREAYEAARRRRAAGPLVRRVFEGAVRAGTRLHEIVEAATAPSPPHHGTDGGRRALRAGAGQGTVEGIVADELERFEEWRARREAFATVMA